MGNEFTDNDSDKFDFSNNRLAFCVNAEYKPYMNKLFKSASISFVFHDNILSTPFDYDIVVIDIEALLEKLEPADVLILLKEIKSKRQSKIICLWARFFYSDLHSEFMHIQDDFCTKPVDIIEIQLRVQKALSK